MNDDLLQRLRNADIGVCDEAAEAIEELRDVVIKYHRWLETVELSKADGGYMGLDHAVGTNRDGCSGCAVLPETP